MHFRFVSFYIVLHEQKQTESSLVDREQGKEDKGICLYIGDSLKSYVVFNVYMTNVSIMYSNGIITIKLYF